MNNQLISTIRILDFTKQDQDATYAFCKSIFEELEWPMKYGEGLQDIYSYFDLPKGIFVIAKLSDKVIGCGGIRELITGVGLIKRFYVTQELRGKGVALRILEELISRAKTKSLTSLVLDTGKGNESGNRFYLKHGFKLFTPPTELRESWLEMGEPEIFNYYKFDLN